MKAASRRGTVLREALRSERVAGLLRRLHADCVADEIDRRAGRVPPVVTVHVPPHVGGPARFLMDSQAGRDQIARDLWRGGWAAFEHPFPDLFAMWAARCRNTILDVGANTGFYSLLAARVAPSASVHAFEPYPPVAALLRRNLGLNGLGDRVRVFTDALSASAGSATLFVPEQTHGLVETSASLDLGERAVGQTLAVDVTTVDEHVRSRRVVVDLLKIDAETLDHMVIAGAADVLDRDRPVVFFELLPHVPAAPIEARRVAHDYVCTSVRPDGSLHRSESAVHDPATWNYVLVPAELADRFVAAASEIVSVR